MNSFLSNLDLYVKLNRYENITLHHVMKGIKMKDLAFLSIIDNISHSKNNYLLKEQLLFGLMYWIFNDFVNPILSNCFYITEAEGRGCDI